MFCVCHAFLSIHCGLVVTCWERADLLALLCAMCLLFFVTFPCGVLGQVWYLIELISDPCLLTYFLMQLYVAGHYNATQFNTNHYNATHKATHYNTSHLNGTHHNVIRCTRDNM